MRAFLEPHSAWIENSLGCTTSQSVTFEIDVPFGQFAAESLLGGVPLDHRCLPATDELKSMITKWTTPENLSPRIELSLSHVQGTQLSSKATAWDPHWRDCPIAIWLRDVAHAVVSVQIPYVSLAGGMNSDSRNWLLVNRTDVAVVLAKLGTLLKSLPKCVYLLGGRTLELPAGGYNWDNLVLDEATNGHLRKDFELFFERENWFRRHGLPFRRGYLFYGPPGNGKTTAIRIMASHPAVTAYTIDFCDDRADNDALNSLFEAARRAAPSLVIFEDLDRVFAAGENTDRSVRISLQHFLNCVDGIGSQDGLVVVATANHPDALDQAIVRRPGRFDHDVRTLNYFYYYNFVEYLRNNARDLWFGDDDYAEAEHNTRNSRWYCEKNMQGPPFMECILFNPFDPKSPWRMRSHFAGLYQTEPFWIGPRIELWFDPELPSEKEPDASVAIGKIMLGTGNQHLKRMLQDIEPYKSRLKPAGSRNFHREIVDVRQLPFDRLADSIRAMLTVIFENQAGPDH